MRRGFLLFLLLALGLGTLGSGFAQDAEEDPLLHLLRFIPDTPATRQELRYGDYAAWHRSWDVTPATSFAELEALSERNYLLTLYVKTTLSGAPSVLNLSNLREEPQALFGFDFLNIDRFITAGQPPDDLSVLGHSLAAEDIRAALRRQGYRERALDDERLLFSIRADYAVRGRDDLPPYVLNQMNRIVVGPGELITGRASAIIEESLAAYAGDVPSLADDPNYRSAIQALRELTDYGDLLGVIFAPWEHFQTLPRGHSSSAEQRRAQQEALAQAYADLPIPRYELVAMANSHRQDDQATYLSLVLVFPEGTDITETPAILSTRMQHYESITQRQPLEEVFAERGVSFQEEIAMEANGQPVVIIVLRLPDPDPETRPNLLTWLDFYPPQDMQYLLTDLDFDGE